MAVAVEPIISQGSGFFLFVRLSELHLKYKALIFISPTVSSGIVAKDCT